MAELPTYDTTHPAEMDYPEHERTYALFLALFKWGTIGTIAIMIGMMVGLMLGGGFLGGFLSFAVVLAIAYFIA